MKKTLCLALALLLFLLPGCRKAESNLPDPGSVSESGFPVTVTDQAGRTVTIEKKPERIVSGYYISTSTLLALGCEEQLVGIEAKAKKRAIYRLSAPDLLALPDVGTAKEPDLERCASLSPDLVILPLSLQKPAEALMELGIPVILVSPENTESSDEMVKLLGTVTGTRERAEELSAFIGKMRERLSSLPKKEVTVYMAGNAGFLRTAGDQMYQAEVIRLAGFQNAAAEITESYWADVSYEQVLSWNPDVILIASEATYSVDDVLGDPMLKDVKAVQNGKVFAMPVTVEAWDSPVPGAVLGSYYLAKELREEVTEEEYQKAADEFYGKFYGFFPSENGQ